MDKLVKEDGTVICELRDVSQAADGTFTAWSDHPPFMLPETCFYENAAGKRWSFRGAFPVVGTGKVAPGAPLVLQPAQVVGFVAELDK